MQQHGEPTRGLPRWPLEPGMGPSLGAFSDGGSRAAPPAWVVLRVDPDGRLAFVHAPRADASPGGAPPDASPSSEKASSASGAPTSRGASGPSTPVAPASSGAPSRDVHGSGGPPPNGEPGQSTTNEREEARDTCARDPHERHRRDLPHVASLEPAHQPLRRVSGVAR